MFRDLEGARVFWPLRDPSPVVFDIFYYKMETTNPFLFSFYVERIETENNFIYLFWLFICSFYKQRDPLPLINLVLHCNTLTRTRQDIGQKESHN